MQIKYELYVKVHLQKNTPRIMLIQFGILSAVKPVYQPSGTGCIVSLNMSQQLIIWSPNIKVINSLAKSQPLPHGRCKERKRNFNETLYFLSLPPTSSVGQGPLEGGEEKKKSKLTIKVIQRTRVRCREMGGKKKEMHTYQCHISSLQFPVHC